MFVYTGGGSSVEGERCVLTWGGGDEFAAVGNQNFQSCVQDLDGRAVESLVIAARLLPLFRVFANLLGDGVNLPLQVG